MTTIPLTATFTAPGTFTWTCPAGVTSVTVACTGGGGGGGAAKAAAGSQGGGGGGGEAALEPALAVSPGVVYTGTAGAPGTAGTAGGNGGTGGSSSFTGDSTTVSAHGGTGGTAGTASGPGQNGVGGDGSLNSSSGQGGDGGDGTPATNGGGGGGAGGVDTSQGYPGSAASDATPGAASGGTFPGGAGGAGSTSGAGSGFAGTAPGGGGGGALSTGTARSGGAGGAGQVVITWTMTSPLTLSAATTGGSYTFTAPAGATAVTAQAWGAGGGGRPSLGAATVAPLAGGGNLVGCTVQPRVYSSCGLSWMCAASKVDAFTSAAAYGTTGAATRTPAGTIQKLYLPPRLTPIPRNVRDLTAAGVTILACTTPPTTQTPADLTNWINDLQAWIAYGVSFDVIIYQECNHIFSTAQEYITLARYYWDTTDPVSGMRGKDLGLGLVYDPSYSAGQTSAISYFPTNAAGTTALPDAITCDWYCVSGWTSAGGDNLTGSTPKHPLDPVAALADNWGIPFGLGEWGITATPAPPAALWSSGAFGRYCQYIIDFFSGRPKRYACLWYAGDHNTTFNEILNSSSASNGAAGLARVWDALSGGATTSSGSGGGGGEFAQEATLAITDSHLYALGVGAGTQAVTGGNSTVAGDSVTVTAHGGHVAAVVTAGGSGGTGSSNTTHHDGGDGGAGGIASGGGGGGGSSGGTASAGNTGTGGTTGAGGRGGAAVTGGGAGAAGGGNGGDGGGGHSPGGGGGGSGATAVAGAGADGQITLSSFVIHPAGPGGFTLAPLAFSATGSVQVSFMALAPLAFSATGSVTGGPATVSSSGSFALAPLAVSGTGNCAVPAGTVATSGGFALAPLAFQSPSLQTAFPAHPLPVMVEILVNGVWADITAYVYQRDAITISGRGRPNEASTPQPTQTTLTLNNRDGSFSPQNTAGQFYPYLGRNTQIRISVNAAISAQGATYTGYRFWGEVPAWPPLWDPTGTDVYVSITAAGVLQRMAQSKSLGSPIARYYAQQLLGFPGGAIPPGALAPSAYWPCEDGASATFFASGLSGGSPMTWSGGSPGLSADSSVPGSNPFAQLNGTTWSGAPGDFTAGGITYTTPGAYTWTCPGGITSITAECWGSGGGGGNGLNGAGGAGGEYAAETHLAVTPGKSYTLSVGTGGSGGAGSFSANGIGGQDGIRSVFSGDAKTVIARGGKGAGGHNLSPAAPGGTGSSNTTHHDGGDGAATSGHFGGGGGGSSAGPASAGHNGGQSTGTGGATGGAAVVDGGAGGNGGTGALASQGAVATSGLMPVPGPGGGGGGGGFSSYNNYNRAGGGGQNGQVRISFGAVPTPPALVLRGIIDVPSGGGVNNSVPLQVLAKGAVADLHIKYLTGGHFQLIGKDSGGSTVIDSGSVSFGADGQPLLVSAELRQGFTNHISWTLTALAPGATSVVATATGTITGTLGGATQIVVNGASPVDTGSTGVGHVSLQYARDSVLNLAQALNAYAGELAGARFLRLCDEQNIPVALAGDVADTPQMGNQVDDLLVGLLQDCENTDLGQMFEPRDRFGLGYITRVAMQNQSPDCMLDYSLGQLAQGLAPTDDDALTRNDIIATRINGSSYEIALTTGPMSTQDPPNGVGLYSYPVSVNVFADTQLAGFAAWLLDLGTTDEFRYPTITIDLTRAQVSDGTFPVVAALDITSYLQIINLPPWLPAGTVDQLCIGFTETLNAYEWTVTVNTVPEAPYTALPGTFPAW